MFKPKTTISGRLENSSGAQIRTEDLRVMSPTSCHCSTPHRLPFFWLEEYSTATGICQGDALTGDFEPVNSNHHFSRLLISDVTTVGAGVGTGAIADDCSGTTGWSSGPTRWFS